MRTSALVIAAMALALAAPTVDASAEEAPGQVAAILVQPLHDAQVVRGDDGKDHVVYTLLVVSVFDAPVTLSSVTVVGPAGKELARVDGETLAAATQELFSHALVSAIPASGAVAVEVDVGFAPGTVPARVTHRIAYTVPAGSQSAPILGPTEVDATTVDSQPSPVVASETDGPEVAIDRRRAIVIKPPLAGDGWLATTACCTPNPHTDLRLAIDGVRIETGETFAVDWGRVEGNRLFEGDGSTNEQSYAFGADVLAVADGTVAFTQDGEPEQIPGSVRLADRLSAIGGNKVILKIAPKVYAAYEHLQPGTLKVKVGDKVKAGAVLAKLGNTGPSTGAHLHFGLVDRPDVVTGRALPFVLDRYTVAGTVNLAASEGDTLVISPESREVRSAYPLYGGIQNFP
jgi:peptidase M23-like protein